MSEPFIGEIKAVGFNYAPHGYAFANGAMLNVQQNQALFALLSTTFGGDGVSTFGIPNLQSRSPIGFYTGGALPVGANGQALTHFAMGQVSGQEQFTISTGQLPPHIHPAAANAVASTTATATTTVTPNITGLSATTTINALTAPTSRVVTPAGNLLTVPQTSGGSPIAVQTYAPPGAGTAATMAPGMATTSLSGAISAPATTSVTASTSVGVNVTIGITGQGLPMTIVPARLAINYIIATLGVWPPRN
jgi:microcystin-dependent protein